MILAIGVFLWNLLWNLAIFYAGFVFGWAYYGGTIAEMRRQLIDVNLVDETIAEVEGKK